MGDQNDTYEIFIACHIYNVCVCSGKTQVMGEIKIALKKEMKTEGENLVLEILQCRNITYKFKTPDHLPGIVIIMIIVINSGQLVKLTSLQHFIHTAIISVRIKESIFAFAQM